MIPCLAPLPMATCIDYWLGETLPEAEAEIEEHLLACTECSQRVERIAALAPAVCALVRQGGLPLCLTPVLLARLEDDGLRIRHYRVLPGGRVRCTAGPDDDFVAMRLAGEFRPGERVDLVFENAPSGLAARRVDVPVDHALGELVFVEPGDLIRRLPAQVAVIRLTGIAETGRRQIGEYTLHHTPWPDG